MPAQLLVLADDGLASALDRATERATRRVVEDPEDFRRLLIEETPRVIVCVRPPATDAEIALVREERRRRPTLRAMLVNAADGVAERLDALADGFDDAVAASMDPDELAGRIAVLVARAPRRPRARASIALRRGLELDLDAHELRCDGETLHVRPKELRLLTLLATHPGRVYTRRQLLDRVWGADHAGDQRTVDVHMAWLRSKVEPDPDHPVHLVTVRGIGYRFDLERP